MDTGAGVCRASLAAALKRLEQKRLILIERSGAGDYRRRATNRYCLNLIEPLPAKADDRVVAVAPATTSALWRRGGSSIIEPTDNSPTGNTNNVVKRRRKKRKLRKEPERVDWLRDEACTVTGDDQPLSRRAFARYAILLPDAVYLELLHQARRAEGVRHRGKLFGFLCRLKLSRSGGRLPTPVRGDDPEPAQEPEPPGGRWRRSSAYARLRRRAQALAASKSLAAVTGFAGGGGGSGSHLRIPRTFPVQGAP